MWQDPVGQITKMDQFLGLDRGPALCQQIAEACHFSKLKEAKDAQVPEAIKHIYKERAAGPYRKGNLITGIVFSTCEITSQHHAMRQQDILNLCACNVRTLRTENDPDRPIDEFDQMKWDAIGLCEAYREGEGIVRNNGRIT